MRIPTDPDEIHLISPAQIAACQQLQRDYAALRGWAERAAQQIQARVESGTASPTERALWQEWQGLSRLHSTDKTASSENLSRL